jgi:uncharacterized Zn-finger protein
MSTTTNIEAAAPPPSGPGAPEIVMVTSHRIRCDGVGGALGHPRIWLEMGEAPFVECPYCDRRFVMVEDHGAAETAPAES